MASSSDPTQRPPDKSWRATYLPQPITERGTPTILAFHPKEEKVIYTSGKSVVIRSLTDLSDVLVYKGHVCRVNVAKFSPNGYWVASGDSSGKVRIWSYDNPEHNLKLETTVFTGEIKDLAWDPESKRVVAVGDGRSLFAKVFMWDTGNSVGEVVGHQKRITTVDYKPSRPFRIYTGGEDFNVCYYEGPPFKFKHSHLGQHTNFVNCIRFSPDGTLCVSVGSDKKIILYDGKTGELLGEIPNDHKGSIYSVAWSPDSKQIATASGDKTVKVFDVSSKQLGITYTLSETPQVSDMQACVAWSHNGTLLSLSLSGDINLLDRLKPNRPKRILQGHQVSVDALTVDSASGAVISGSYDGILCSWLQGNGRRVGSHKGGIAAIASLGNGKFVSVGWDDVARIGSVDCASEPVSCSLPGQPTGVATAPGCPIIAVATTKGISIIKDGNSVFQSPEFSWTPTSIALSPSGDEVIVGGKEDLKLHIFAVSANGSLSESGVISGHRGAPACISYSPDGSMIAVGDSNREVCIWNATSREAIIQGLWTYHTTRVTGVAWSPSGKFLASGSTDESIYLWNIAAQQKIRQIEFAHRGGVTALSFINESTLVSSGADACINTWNVAEYLQG